MVVVVMLVFVARVRDRRGVYSVLVGKETTWETQAEMGG